MTSNEVKWGRHSFHVNVIMFLKNFNLEVSVWPHLPLHGSSVPIPIYLFIYLLFLAQIRYNYKHASRKKSTWILIFSDRFQASFVCEIKRDMNRTRAFASAM